MKRLILILALIFPLNAHAVWEVVPPLWAAFSASSALFTPYATPTDVCMLGNPNGASTIRVSQIRVWGSQSTAGTNAWYIIKRSTLDGVGSNSSALTAVNHDALVVAPGADILKITAAPAALGTSLGTLRGADVFAPQSSSAQNGIYTFDFAFDQGVNPIVLHKNEMIALNFNGAAVPTGMVVSCEFTWAEY